MQTKLSFYSRILFIIISLFAYAQGALAGGGYDTGRSLGPSSQPGNGETITISSQAEFDRVRVLLVREIRSGSRAVEIRFLPGRYYYSNGHFSLDGIDAPGFSLTLSGEDAVLIAAGEDFQLNRPPFSNKRQAVFSGEYNYGDIFLGENLNELSFSSGIQQTDSLLEVVDENESICRIHTDKSSRFRDGKYIIVTTWYTSINGPIIKVEGDWIYFKSSSLQYNNTYKCFNINYDYGYAKRMPRYIVFNDPKCGDVYIKNKKLYANLSECKVHQCSASSFLTTNKTKLKQLKIDGLTFVGSAKGASLMSLLASDIGVIQINNCSFRLMRNRVIDIHETDNVSISACSFKDCYSTCVYSENGSKNTRVTECVFSNNGKDFTQHHCVWCMGEDFYVANNVFIDFSYAAIRTGVLPWNKKVGANSGIIEDNEIFYDKDYFESFFDHTLMDSGAIYVSTRNDNTIIRFNYIHDYIGLKDNRGIFCDTGTQNTHIYGNIILNVPNSNTIEIWRVASSDKTVPDANEGNSAYQNILGGKYRFEGKETAKKNVQGKNYVVYSNKRPSIIKRNLNKYEDDEFICFPDEFTIDSILNDSLIRSSVYYQRLKRYSTKEKRHF